MIDIFKRWFSHSKEQDIDDSQNPWAGLASYEDPETAERKLKFCGRDDDSYDLARLIMGNVFVTLYGKSGIGKTSLLNAGVFPELREEQYTPVSIRLGMRDDEHPQSYQTMIVEAVERVVKRTEIINVIDEQQDQQSLDYLWNYFARHHFYRYDEPTTPVIVFDQFEEVFRGHRNEAETLLRQLDYLNDKDHSLDSCQVDSQPYRYEQNFRFVVSIREDDLYRLEDSIDNCYLPALKRCRYRLRSLSEQGACDAILIPGEGLFSPNEKNSIADAIISKSHNDDGSISTNIISLLCSRIYVDFKKSGADHITPPLVDSFIKGNPFESFYNEATRGFSNKEKSYIEDNLVDSTSRCRKPVFESEFKSNVKEWEKLLSGDTRILQRISTSSDGAKDFVELIHDSFCEPLIEKSMKHTNRRRFYTAALSIFSLLLIIIAFLSYVGIYSANEKMKENQARFIAEKVLSLVDEGDSYLARLLALEVLPNDLNHPNRPYIPEAGTALLNASQENNAIIYDFGNNAIYSPDGSRIASYNKNKIHIIDSSSGGLLKEFMVDSSCYIYSIIFNPEGKIISLSSDNIVRAWDIEEDCCDTLIGDNKYKERVLEISFSPEGICFATFSADSLLRVWDNKTKKCIAIRTNPNSSKKITYSPDGKTIATSSKNKIQLWSSKDLELQDHFMIDSIRRIDNILFSHDGKMMFFNSDNNVIIYNLSTKRIIQKFPCDGTYSISKDEKTLATIMNKSIYLWDLTTGEQTKKWEVNNIHSISFSPNSFQLLLNGNNSIRFIDLKKTSSTKSLHRLANYIYFGWGKDYSSMTAAKYCNNGSFILSISWDANHGSFNSVSLWDANDGKLVDSLYHDSWCGDRNIAISPNGKYLAFETKTGVKEYDIKEKQLTSLKHRGSDLVFNANDEYLYFSSEDTVFKWNVILKELSVVNIFPNRVWNICTCENTLAAIPKSWYDGNTGTVYHTIQIWNVDNKKLISVLEDAHKGSVLYSKFSDDGSLYAIINGDGVIKLYDVGSGKIIFEHYSDEKPKCLSFSPDNHVIAIGKDNGSIDILNIFGNIIYKMDNSNGEINSISFSPSCDKIMTAHKNGAIEIRNYVHIQQLINSTRERFKNRQLTPEERRKYYLESKPMSQKLIDFEITSTRRNPI